MKSVLLYEAHAWRLIKTTLQKIKTFYNTCLKRIVNIRWPERITNEELWKRARPEPIDIHIRRRKGSWIGHTLRKPTSNFTCPVQKPKGQEKEGASEKHLEAGHGGRIEGKRHELERRTKSSSEPCLLEDSRW